MFLPFLLFDSGAPSIPRERRVSGDKPATAFFDGAWNSIVLTKLFHSRNTSPAMLGILLCGYIVVLFYGGDKWDEDVFLDD